MTNSADTTIGQPLQRGCSGAPHADVWAEIRCLRNERDRLVAEVVDLRHTVRRLDNACAALLDERVPSA